MISLCQKSTPGRRAFAKRCRLRSASIHAPIILARATAVRDRQQTRMVESISVLIVAPELREIDVLRSQALPLGARGVVRRRLEADGTGNWIGLHTSCAVGGVAGSPSNIVLTPVNRILAARVGVAGVRVVVHRDWPLPQLPPQKDQRNFRNVGDQHQSHEIHDKKRQHAEVDTAEWGVKDRLRRKQV